MIVFKIATFDVLVFGVHMVHNFLLCLQEESAWSSAKKDTVEHFHQTSMCTVCDVVEIMIDCPCAVIDHQEIAVDLKCIVMENGIIDCKVTECICNCDL